jgi:serine/threonine protein kinase
MRQLLLYLLLIIFSCSSLASVKLFDTKAGTQVALASGAKLELVHRLGSGGFGDVYLMKDSEGQAVVLKVPRYSVWSNRSELEDFRKSNLSRSHLVIPFALKLSEDFLGGDKKVPVYLMPLGKKTLEEDLEALNRRERRAEFQDEVEDLRQIFEERLQLAHEIMQTFFYVLHRLSEQGYSHNDFKPSNLIYHEDRWNLIDFDLLTPLTEKTRGYTGTFAAPELRVSKPQNAVSDMYSLGLVVMRIVMGQRAPDSILERETFAQQFESFLDSYSSKMKPSQVQTIADLRKFVSAALEVNPSTRAQRLSEVKLAFPSGLKCYEIY